MPTTVATDSAGTYNITIDEVVDPGLVWLVTVAQDDNDAPTSEPAINKSWLGGPIDSIFQGFRTGVELNDAVTGALPADLSTVGISARNLAPFVVVRMATL